VAAGVLAGGTKISYVTGLMTGNEFLRRMIRLGRERGIAISFDRRHGKGSHGTLRLGSRKTTLKDLRKEIGTPLLHAMLGQLGLSRRDLDD
jgi:mRNA interferase HicA